MIFYSPITYLNFITITEPLQKLVLALLTNNKIYKMYSNTISTYVFVEFLKTFNVIETHLKVIYNYSQQWQYFKLVSIEIDLFRNLCSQMHVYI